MMRPLLLALIVCLAGSPAASGARIKDIVTLRGVRANQLIGYGLVVGLNGTGDSLRNSPFAGQALKSMLDRMGVNIRGLNPRVRNLAAVMVTAELPPFIGKGSRIDVTVSSLGDATSLAGGSLIMTPLMGADAKTYAVAQGALASSGTVAAGKAESFTSGVPTAARIPNGAMIEREVEQPFANSGIMLLELRNPDFETAIRVTDAINAFSRRRYGLNLAKERNLRTIAVMRPPGVGAARLMANIGRLEAEPDTPARVVIDQRTGTIVIGRNVRISTVAVAHGSLVVKVAEDAAVSQPLPFSKGRTVVTPLSEIGVDQPGGKLAIVRGSNLQTLVSGLNRIGLKPAGIIAILQAIKSAGALQADLVVQ